MKKFEQKNYAIYPSAPFRDAAWDKELAHTYVAWMVLRAQSEKDLESVVESKNRKKK